MKTTNLARGASNRIFLMVGICTIALSACGGGSSGSTSQSTTYNLQAGYSNFVTSGLNTNVSLSGTDVTSSGTVSFTGTGTLAYAAATTTTLDNSPALSQVESLNATVTVDGQSAPVTATVTDFYAPTSSAFLGETSASGAYAIAQTPITWPDSVVGGSSGTLGTISDYTDSTMSVLTGTSQLSYTVSAPVDSGGPVSVAITNAIYDTTNTLVETDITTFTLSTSNVLTYVSESAQTSTSTLLISAQ